VKGTSLIHCYICHLLLPPRALTLTRKIGPSSSRELRACLVWLRETRQFKFDLASQLQEPSVQIFTGLLASLAPLVEGQAELYWVGSRLAAFLQPHLLDTRPLVDCLGRLMGEDPLLREHLTLVRVHNGLSDLGSSVQYETTTFMGSGLNFIN
jgi:hypothetical protein